MPQFSRGWSPLPVATSAGGDYCIWSDPSGRWMWYPPGVEPLPIQLECGFYKVACYPDQQSADNALRASGHYFGNQDCGLPATPTGPQPPAPTGGGSAPTPTPSQNPYWNVCFRAGGGLNMFTVQAQSSSAAMATNPDSVSAFGPYADSATASANVASDYQRCQGGGGVKATCNTDPLIKCPLPPSILGGLGTPGTAEWCAALDLIVVEVGKIGGTLYKFVDDLLNSKTRIDSIDAYINDKSTSTVGAGVASVIRQVFCWIAPYIETVRTSIACFRQWMNALFPTCNNEATWGLIIIRSFLLTLERFEWGSDAAIWIVARSGITIDPIMQTVEYLIGYSCSVGLISAEQAAEAFKYGYLDEKVFDCILSVHNLQRKTFDPYLMARGDKVGWREAMQYVRRTNGTPADEDTYLRLLGVLDPAYREALRTVYDELPTVSDHLEFLRKNVFDDAYVKDFRLMEGFEDRFWAKFGGQLRALGMTKETAGLHYAAHWINPSFQQQFQMVQRLRPGRAPANLQFTRADLLRTMQEMDVGAYFRERLEAVSHPVPNLTLCLQMYQFGTVDDAEFIEKLKDLGFDDANATAILDAQRIKVRRLNASSGHGWTPAALAQGFAIGKLTDQQIDDEMRYLGYSQEDANRLKRRSEIELAIAPVKRLMQSSIRSALTTQSNAYKCGAIDGEQLRAAYRNAGIPDNVAQVGVSDVDASVAVDICRKQVASFRSALLRGKVNVEQLRGIMAGAGMPQLRVEQLLKSWVIEAGLRAPQATAAQILRWVGQGLLDRDTALSRLLNLGWTDPDLALMLAESLAKQQAAQTRIQSQAARSQQAAARAALRLAQENETAANRLRSKLKGIASRSTLQKWYKEGLIDDGYFIDAMKARGFDDDSTLKYLAESQAARLKSAKPPQAKPPKGAQTNGTSSGG